MSDVFCGRLHDTLIALNLAQVNLVQHTIIKKMAKGWFKGVDISDIDIHYHALARVFRTMWNCGIRTIADCWAASTCRTGWSQKQNQCLDHTLKGPHRHETWETCMVPSHSTQRNLCLCLQEKHEIFEPANEMMKNEDWNLRNMLDRSSWEDQRGV